MVKILKSAFVFAGLLLSFNAYANETIVGSEIPYTAKTDVHVDFKGNDLSHLKDDMYQTLPTDLYIKEAWGIETYPKGKDISREISDLSCDFNDTGHKFSRTIVDNNLQGYNEYCIKHEKSVLIKKFAVPLEGVPAFEQAINDMASNQNNIHSNVDYALKRVAGFLSLTNGPFQSLGETPSPWYHKGIFFQITSYIKDVKSQDGKKQYNYIVCEPENPAEMRVSVMGRDITNAFRDIKDQSMEEVMKVALVSSEMHGIQGKTFGNSVSQNTSNKEDDQNIIYADLKNGYMAWGTENDIKHKKGCIVFSPMSYKDTINDHYYNQNQSMTKSEKEEEAKKQAYEQRYKKENEEQEKYKKNLGEKTKNIFE